VSLERALAVTPDVGDDARDGPLGRDIAHALGGEQRRHRLSIRSRNYAQHINHQPLTTNHQPLTTNHQPLTTNHQPLTTNHQPPTTNHQPPTTNHQPASLAEANDLILQRLERRPDVRLRL